jgi:hypothetical protein
MATQTEPLQILWDFQRDVMPALECYRGNMLFVYVADGQASGFVGPREAAFIHAVYDRYEEIRRDDDGIGLTRIRL